MTALLAFEYCDMTEDVVITAESLTCLGSGYASIGLKEGNVISMEQALYAMLLASSNEVAYAVGETVAKTQGEDYQWFIDEMNRKVEELGGNQFQLCQHKRRAGRKSLYLRKGYGSDRKRAV